MKTVLSGIRSTGHLHLGNYFGALKNFTQLQHKATCYFFIADLHSLTTHPNPEDSRSSIKVILSEYLASGLIRRICFVHSEHIPEISELFVLLNMLAYKGESWSAPLLKTRSEKPLKCTRITHIPRHYGADILVHRANWVPVGKDQEQHLEIARVLARRFNNMYGADVFPEPQAYNFGQDLVKIPGLDGTGKMGKSEGNGIYLIDDEKTIRKKSCGLLQIRDLGSRESHGTGITNLFTLLSVVSEPDVVSHFRQQYDNCTIKYGELKKQLATDICKHTLPIKAKIEEIYNNEPYLKQVVEQGAEKARQSARATMKLVREAMGSEVF